MVTPFASLTRPNPHASSYSILRHTRTVHCSARLLPWSSTSRARTRSNRKTETECDQGSSRGEMRFFHMRFVLLLSLAVYGVVAVPAGPLRTALAESAYNTKDKVVSATTSLAPGLTGASGKQNDTLETKKKNKIRRGSSRALRVYHDEGRGETTMCRMPSTCMNYSGHLYIPEELRRFEKILTEICRMQKSEFSFYKPGDPRLNSKVSVTYPHTHLLNTDALRFHIPHFFQDFQTTIMNVAPSLQRKHAGAMSEIDRPFQPVNTSVRCYDPKGGMLASKGIRCGAASPKEWAVLVEDRAASITWPEDMIAKLGSKNSRVTLRTLYKNATFLGVLPEKHVTGYNIEKVSARPTPAKTVCYTSVGRRVITQRLSADAYEKHVLFDHSNIKRRISEHTPHPETGRCELRITVLHRPNQTATPDYPLPPGSRRILNVHDLVQAVQEEALKRGVDVRIFVREDFGRIGFSKQFSQMQNTDVLISVHGAELTNSGFLPRGASVIEIYPFRYTPDSFASGITSFGLHHYSHIAAPDVEAFRKCILHFNPPGSKAYGAAKQIVRRFEERASAYRGSHDDNAREALGLFWDESNTVHLSRACGRVQRLVVNAKRVARQALARHEQICAGQP